MSKTVLITGATGKQGGSVINALLAAKANFEILAVTRDVQSASAKKLAHKSPLIKLVSGNFDDTEGIFKRAKEVSSAPVWGVFGVQTGIGNGKGAEERQGKALIDAAIANNVKHFVYTSVDRGGNNDSPTEIPHFAAKHHIEQHLFSMARNNANQMTWTVLRPVAFMENLTPDFNGKVFATAYDAVLKGKPLQLVATSDIGFFAAQALINSPEWAGKSLSLAGDDLTYAQFRSIFKDKTGSDLPTTYTFLVLFLLWMVKDFGLMFRWFRDVGYNADIKALRKMNPELKTFATWLQTESAFAKR